VLATAEHFTGLFGGWRARPVLGRRSLRFEAGTTVILTQVLPGFPQSHPAGNGSSKQCMAPLIVLASGGLQSELLTASSVH
jgi:hypothetical protein